MGKAIFNNKSKRNEPFQKFLLSEYNNIAKAHFNTVNTISNFFRYFLLLVTVPVPIVVLLFQKLEMPKLEVVEGVIKPFAGIGSIVVFIVGICVVAYIMNLRFDALLYARTVNGIRRYFYNLSNIDIFSLNKIRVLPSTVTAPSYREWRYFYPVVFALSVINGFYLFFSILLFDSDILKNHQYIPFIVSIVSSILLSTIIYICLSNHREKGYLSRPIIGVDIDGVLNRHRHHFCDLLEKLCGKRIDPENITKIPVDECKDLGCDVEKIECHTIFNEPGYWSDMPVNDDCAESIRKIRDALNFKVEIFTYRPWPEQKTFPKNRVEEYKLKWHKIDMGWRREAKAIKKITKEWLKKHEIRYDKITIENGSEYTPNPKMWRKNRFQSARKRHYAFFVEDELTKAKHLAQFCDIVFLLNHPYNQSNDNGSAKNIIRVGDWKEIYQVLKEKI